MPTVRGPEDFWAVLEDANARFSNLEEALLSLDEAGLENFHGLVSVLSGDAIVEDVIYYEAGDLFLSEDGLEDFGWWVVTQGRAFFDALTREELPLQDALAMHMQD